MIRFIIGLAFTLALASTAVDHWNSGRFVSVGIDAVLIYAYWAYTAE